MINILEKKVNKLVLFFILFLTSVNYALCQRVFINNQPGNPCYCKSLFINSAKNPIGVLVIEKYDSLSTNYIKDLLGAENVNDTIKRFNILILENLTN